MISLTHITEAELRQYYLLEGKISGRDKEYNMLNGVQQEYVASRIYDFIIWNDHCNKSKLYAGERVAVCFSTLCDVILTRQLL